MRGQPSRHPLSNLLILLGHEQSDRSQNVSPRDDVDGDVDDGEADFDEIVRGEVAVAEGGKLAWLRGVWGCTGFLRAGGWKFQGLSGSSRTAAKLTDQPFSNKSLQAPIPLNIYTYLNQPTVTIDQ
jgi:hypothetical protein